jgi:sulfotransferase
LPLVLNKNIIYVTGLPRSGSTLLCQLLGHHPHIYSINHSSPLSHVIEKIRDTLSDDEFLLSQLDVNFELTYERMLNSYRGFINGWFAETEKNYVVDKNRVWLALIETVNLIDPAFKMIVCLRDLVDVYGSIEAQHQKTLLLNFPDRLSPYSAYTRADALFKNEGLIGRALKSIENLQDIINEDITRRICYLTFEELVEKPLKTMKTLYEWLELPAFDFDPLYLETKPHESDSYYRFKYRHPTHPFIKPPAKHRVPIRIRTEILKSFTWYYQKFYPGKYHAF